MGSILLTKASPFKFWEAFVNASGRQKLPKLSKYIFFFPPKSKCCSGNIYPCHGSLVRAWKQKYAKIFAVPVNWWFHRIQKILPIQCKIAKYIQNQWALLLRLSQCAKQFLILELYENEWFTWNGELSLSACKTSPSIWVRTTAASIAIIEYAISVLVILFI